MSLRDKGTSLVVTGTGAAPAAGSLRRSFNQDATAALTSARAQALAARLTASGALAACRVAHVGFIVDATASRAGAWEKAQEIQIGMMGRLGNLGHESFVRMMHFGGDGLVDHGWDNDAKKLCDAMGAVSCVPGSTQILPALRDFLGDDGKEGHAIILVGDTFEEDRAELEEIAGRLRERRIQVFALLEGNNPRAHEAFSFLAEKTGGKFLKFGPDALLDFQDICVGVALISAGGAAALAKLGNKRVETLLLPAPRGP